LYKVFFTQRWNEFFNLQALGDVKLSRLHSYNHHRGRDLGDMSFLSWSRRLFNSDSLRFKGLDLAHMVLPFRQEGVVQTETVQAMRESAANVDPFLHYFGGEHSTTILVSSLEESL
jgi:hypothetical protein